MLEKLCSVASCQVSCFFFFHFSVSISIFLSVYFVQINFVIETDSLRCYQFFKYLNTEWLAISISIPFYFVLFFSLFLERIHITLKWKIERLLKVTDVCSTIRFESGKKCTSNQLFLERKKFSFFRNRNSSTKCNGMHVLHISLIFLLSATKLSVDFT